MEIFQIDFHGSCEIKARNKQEAESKFWEFVNKNKPLPLNLYEIENTHLYWEKRG